MAVIELQGVSKLYTRYRSPGWAAASMIGLPTPARSREDFLALDNVTFRVEAGEKVGLIGRNGAGKSTVLKLISGQIQPSRGRLTVAGSVQALLQLGAGFHPDFTGRENVLSLLALSGVPGRQRATLLESIEEFAEIGDFIGRPIREYSSGMFARLAFSAATAVRPEILIVDEVLGVGDAYFVGRSVQRMRDLTSQGSTVLYVSHDLSTVQMLCDRAIWIESGLVKDDGEVLPVSKRYLDQVRSEEEASLASRSSKPARPVSDLRHENDRGTTGGRSGTASAKLLGGFGSVDSLSGIQPEDRYGVGGVRIVDFAFRDDEGINRHTLITGRPVKAFVTLECDEGTETVGVVIAVYLPDGQCATQIASNLAGVVVRNPTGTVTVTAHLERLTLGPGDYLVSVGAFPSLDVRTSQELPAYDILDRVYALRIQHEFGTGFNVGIANQEAVWSILQDDSRQDT